MTVMALQSLISALGEEINDPEEEMFLLFSQDLPSQNLGFVDAKATNLDITISGRDLNIIQSPGLLSSNRTEGTTGAVVWKITPLFAEWIALEENVLFQSSVLDRQSTVLELGCGISGIVAIASSPRVGKYVATDQEYVFKWLKPNIQDNAPKPKNFDKVKQRGRIPDSNLMSDNILIMALDWELSSTSDLPKMIGDSGDNDHGINAVIACDCIYNEALVEPMVRTCAEICQLPNASSPGKATVCIIAQQLRSDLVFGAWLFAFHKIFRVWRVPDDLLIEGLREGSGFVIHVGILREKHT
ncbi:hypothetical protein JMJ35_006052 [Cladonia borealis]|uniref:Uncharacterized protein n=1 Tax=Cladonia borealis TaxID=184061 RepID=A0AA39R095_9LECA|nr:hypothetical protein JMJ35_006052 [Cladonia borealis]